MNDPGLAARLHHLARFHRALPHINRHADCGCPHCRAHTWDHAGYPASTMGDGIRGADNTSSTERHALTNRHALTYTFELEAAETALITASIAYHNALVRLGYDPTSPQKPATLDDHIPAGRGSCLACGEFCMGDGETNRLRAGLCHRDYGRYQRWKIKQPEGRRAVGDYVRSLGQVPA